MLLKLHTLPPVCVTICTVSVMSCVFSCRDHHEAEYSSTSLVSYCAPVFWLVVCRFHKKSKTHHSKTVRKNKVRCWNVFTVQDQQCLLLVSPGSAGPPGHFGPSFEVYTKNRVLKEDLSCHHSVSFPTILPGAVMSARHTLDFQCHEKYPLRHFFCFTYLTNY